MTMKQLDDIMKTADKISSVAYSFKKIKPIMKTGVMLEVRDNPAHMPAYLNEKLTRVVKNVLSQELEVQFQKLQELMNERPKRVSK